MTVLVGYLPHKGGRGSLDLGLQLAHALGESMVVVTVVPRQWSTPSLARVDAEFGDYARQVGEEAERQSKDYLSACTVEVETSFHAVAGRSVTSALVEAVESFQAGTLVLGSSDDGLEGRIVVGSTADKLLHSSPVRLALSPRGFESTAADGFSRVTCAFSDSESSVRVVGRAAELSGRLGTQLRIASFGVRGTTMYPPEVGLSAEDSVLDSWAQQAAEAQQRLVGNRVIGDEVEAVIGTGAGWSESMASISWQPDELLAIGSSEVGPIARVFLGSRAAKLVRHSPVPVLVLPAEDDA